MLRRDETDRPARNRLAQEVLACLGELSWPVAGSVPYLADLLDSEDEDVVIGALEYLRTRGLTEARPHVQALAARPSAAEGLRDAARETLEVLGRAS